MARARRVALTGGLASGKSHCLARFAALGAPVIDADALAHDVLAPGSEGLAKVVARFGSDLVGLDGNLDRLRLAKVVFADTAARHELEAIVHPAVYDAIDRWFNGLDARVGIADVPLVFETGHEDRFDHVIAAVCRPDQQLARAIGRGMTETDARRRIAAQLPLEEKAARADDVIDTSGTHEETDRQIDEIWKRLKLRTKN